MHLANVPTAAPIAAATNTLAVPADVRARLDAAVREGRDEAEGWARIHPTGSTKRFRADAIARVTPPPSGDAAAADLQGVRDAMNARTDAGIQRAQHLAATTAWDDFGRVISDIGHSQGPEQAKRAARLVQLAASRTDEITSVIKRSFGRKRPYEIDATIKPVVTRPDGNASYPSGHTSGAYAAALVLAALAPERAAEIVDMAAEVGYSRVYGGVHFPSDVLMGARIASAVVTDVLRREAAGLPPR
ncbi:MAG: phosphatase PAP2 family protein [Thermoleophilia bacterium]|nr:phosphatase PAP2 family protein [Thermoleophilia bacterium]